MNNKEIINTDILRARIMNLVYENLTKKEIEKEVRRIYFEEENKELPSKLTVSRSDDVLKEHRKKNNDSGFDGTIIHLHSEGNNINQTITITRGSELGEKDTRKPIDWTYNLMGIYTGGTDNQYQDTRRFYDDVHKIIINKNNDLSKVKKYGLGHS
ncbi:hypothetical protein A9C19_09715 [Bacillus weihaiensis]|uniref:DUF6792 domain-containing protein n=1 Tax=Bacillus weihaiensis TaxID=1547283 RepID=A0A1L3MRP0_9BACI|nr:DUF6792 domain-containing protein [Bacillus weihaiensis]APH05002.1 hypothetical protein A9C19_09715 [Bacillus weihaiensis]